MATKIIHKKSSVASSVPVPGDLEAGELAVNLADQKIYSKTTGGAIIKMSPVTEGDVTAHEAALTITESQISDLQSYLTAHPSVSAENSVNNSGRTYVQDITLDSFGHVTGLASATETVTNTDTTYSAGSGIDLTGTTFSHTDTSSQASVNNTGRTYIQDITLDTYGHVTALASATETVTNTDTNTTYTAGSGIDLTGTAFSHTDTSSQTSVNNSGRTYIQDVTLDTYGHVTGLGSATETVTNTDTNTTNLAVKNSAGTTQFTDDEIRFAGSGATSVAFDASTKKVTISSTDTNTNTTYSAGSGLSLSGTSFSHSDTSSQSSVNNSGRTYIQDVTLDTYGHVTGLGSATETVTNTDTNTTDWRVQNSGGTQQFAVTAAEGVRFAGSGATSVAFDAATQKITISSTDTNTDTNTTYSAGSGLSLSSTTFSHSDTSSQASVNNSGRTYIQDITLDTYGHVTGLASATETVTNTDTNTTYSTATSSTLGLVKIGYSENGKNYPVELSSGKMFVNVPWSDTNTDTNTTYSAGSGLSLSGTTFSHTDTSSQASVNNSGRTYIQDISLDTYGHVTGISSATETVTNTDTNTTYSADGNYGMTLSGTAFRLEDDRRRNSSSADIKSGNTHDYTFYDASHGIRWYTAGAEEMRLENDGDLHVDGNITAYSTTVSDINLKEDVKPITGALDMIEQLNGYTFTYKKDGKKSAGVIAQEVEKVLPSAVEDIDAVYHGEEGTTHKVVQYDQLHGVLIEAIKELKAEIEELKLAK